MAGKRRHDEGLALALARGLPIVDAARDNGLSSRTVHRRMADPAFRQHVAELRSSLVAEVSGQLTGAASKAVAALEEKLTAKSDSIVVQAARAILENLLRTREMVDFEARISDLERRFGRS